MLQKINIISVLILITVFLGANAFVGSAIIESNGFLDLSNLFNYQDQEFQINTQYQFNEVNPVSDRGATLGRVLFYDKELSVNNTTSCASCHQQENAFGDSRVVALGFEGKPTLRHPMRLINVDFGSDNKRFWDERVTTLENLTTLPIQDTIEMGFSGLNGYPGMDSLISKLSKHEHYKTLFKLSFGDEEITEKRIGDALAQFIRSIISFDSKFDEGYAMIGEEKTDFPNFTDAENRGKSIFFNFPFEDGGPDTPQLFGAGCGFCHKAPSMSILHLTQNNGVIGVVGQPDSIDLTIERSPSLKDMVKPDGNSNGPFMHDGSLETLDDVIDHYNDIPFNDLNTNLSGLLFPDEDGSVDLNLSDSSKADLKAFLLTLSGNDVYINEKWSDPFDENGNILLINNPNCDNVETNLEVSICEGESYEGYTIPGFYQDTFSINPVCDSIRTLELLVLSISTTDLAIEICQGEEYEGLVESGLYTINKIAINGCDSIITLALTVLENSESEEAVTICEGEEYNGFSESGTYIIFDLAANGCDSIHNLDLLVLEESDPECLPSSIQDLDANQIFLNQNLNAGLLSGIVKTQGIYQFNIVSSNGQLLSQESRQISSYFEVNIEALVPGLYFLNIVHDNRQTVKRFIKY